jgi:hypothetical protein
VRRPIEKFTSRARSLLGCVLVAAFFAAPAAHAQDRVLTAVVLVNTQNATGYSTNPTNPGEFQRFTERYLEHLQVPYDLVDVATQSPPLLADRQLIISAHRGLNLSSAWRSAIASAVSGGVGFVNLDSDTSVGFQSHIQSIFGATGSASGTPGLAIAVPAAVQIGGSSRHFIADLQQHFAGDPPGDIVYDFHVDAGGVLRTVTSTVLTGATGTVIARIGADPLIVTSTYGAGRAVHFGTLDYLRADRFGFLMGVDDLFWRSLIWAARKPFVVRGYPRLWSVQMDDTLPGWGQRVRDMYDPTWTGSVAADGTGGPWRVTGYVFTNNLPPGSAERASVINDINTGDLQISPHARGESQGNIYWEDLSGAPLTASTWVSTVQDMDLWLLGNGGADEIPFMSRSMVPHYWNLSNITGSELWYGLGFRYITEIQRAGAYFFTKTAQDRLPLRPFRIYEMPPAPSPDENYPFYFADDYVVNSHSGQPAQTFFGFTTQVINLGRYDRQDVAWPNATRPVSEAIDHFQYYTWRLWSSMAPTQIYTHDGGGGGGNYVLSTPTERRQVIQTVSSWLNERGAEHVFMEDFGAYMRARTRSALTDAAIVGGNLVLTLSGDAATATDLSFFGGNAEGVPVSVGSFAGGAVVSVPVASIQGNPLPTTSGLTPSSTMAENPAFTLTVNGGSFIAGSVVHWNGASRPTTYVSSTQLTAAISAADVAVPGTVAVSVFSPLPGGGVSNAQTFTITGNPVPVSTSLAPGTATAGGAAFTLTVNGSGFMNGSIVRWNGANRTTTYVSPTQVTAAIPASDIAAPTTATITVFNPSPGGGTTAGLGFSVVGPGGSFFDDFNRADNAVLGNGWVEKAASAFSLSVGRVVKSATATGYADNLVYRPGGEIMLDGEASIELRFASVPPGYPQVFVRGQMTTIGNPGTFTGYLLFIDNLANRAYLDRVENGTFIQLAPITLNPTLNTTDTYRLRLRATGTNPVTVSAYVERFTGSGWAAIGQATVNDLAATRIATAGTAGFTGHTESGLYSFDNFMRTSYDGGASPLPMTTGIAPSTAVAGGPAFTLTVNGADFVPSSSVRWNGASRTTTFVSPTQLTAAIPASDIAAAGSASITVFSPAPGGGISNPQTFTISLPANPIPTLTSISPTTATAGGAAFTLTVNGGSFMNGSIVRWNGADRTTTFVSPTQLTAAIPAADIATAGMASVTVFNPAPGGGTTAAQSFSVLGPGGTFFDDFGRPDAAAIGNGWIEKSANAFSLAGGRVTKATTSTGFADNLVYRPGAELMLNGEASVEVRFASLPPGYAQVFVRGQMATIANFGTFTGYLLFVDNATNRAYVDRIQNGAFNVLQQITLSPALNTTDTYRLRLRAIGTNPVVVTASVERYTGSDWAVIGQANVNDTAATRVATAGTAGFTGYVEGGVYSYDNFTRTSFDGASPTPATTSLTPAAGTVGGPAFTLAVNGSNFVPTSVVRWNGADRATTFGSATQLTAAIPASDLAATGTASVTVFSPAPGGGTSNAQTFTIAVPGNPLPVLSSLSPTSATAGGPAFTLTVNGSSFISGSVVRWNGANRTTTFVSSTQLTAAIPASDIAAASMASITVFNPSPGGGTSAALDLPVATAFLFDDFNRADNAVIGNGWIEKTPAAFSLAGNRVIKATTTSGFANNLVYRPGNEVMLDGEASAEVRFASVPPGYAQVFVRGQMATIANANAFTGYLLFVDNATNRVFLDRIENGTFNILAQITLNPVLNTTDTYRLRLRATGTNPVAVSAYVERSTATGWTVIGQAAVNDAAATRVATAGTAGFTGYVEGGIYSYDNFVRQNFDGSAYPAPATTAIIPTSTSAGGPAFNLTVNGSNFVPMSVVRWNGVDRATTFVSPTQLTAAISASDIAAAGTASVTVFNPTPGGGTSNAQTFTINATGGSNPVPVTTSISPPSATAGGAAFTLTVNGSSFINGSTVRWNGTNRTTTFVSSTQLTAAIPATDIATAGTATVTVFTPAPGGGLSNGQTFTINAGGGGNPAPVLSSLMPSSANAGGPAFTLTLSGGSFVSGSVVRWNGANRTTTFVSSTQLTASIPASDITAAGTASVTVFNPTPGGGTSAALDFIVYGVGGSFSDNFNRANNATIGNGWTEKYAPAFSIQNNEVVHINTDPIDYHDAIVYRPQTEDRRDVEVGIEFRVLAGQNFPQVHARVQRDTITQANTLNDYLFFVDGFEPSPGRAIIARQQAVAGQFECYMLAIPFPSPLQTSQRYRLRFRVTGTAPVTLQGFVERYNGTGWDPFASGTITHSSTGTSPPRDPNLYCNPGFLPAPVTTAGAVGFAKWVTNNEVLDNFFWTDLDDGTNPVPVSQSLQPTFANAGSGAFTLTVNGANFVPGAVVRWNGANRTTTFVSSTQLTAAITAADVAAVGSAQVTVFNPTPGGGVSNAQTFTIYDPSAPDPTTVDFDAPAPPGSPGSNLQGIFEGINFGSNQWTWDGAYAANPTNHIYFASSAGTSRTFQFASGARILDSVTVYTTQAGTLTLSDGQGQVATRIVNPGSLQTVTTTWTLPSTTVTVQFTAGWTFGLDDIVYR